jgi:hypothetical protein
MLLIIKQLSNSLLRSYTMDHKELLRGSPRPLPGCCRDVTLYQLRDVKRLYVTRRVATRRSDVLYTTTWRGKPCQQKPVTKSYSVSEGWLRTGRNRVGLSLVDRPTRSSGLTDVDEITLILSSVCSTAKYRRCSTFLSVYKYYMNIS